MEYDQIEAYKGGTLQLRALDNLVRRLVGVYGDAPVELNQTKDELTVKIGRPIPPEDETRPEPQRQEAEQKVEVLPPPPAPTPDVAGEPREETAPKREATQRKQAR